MLKGTTKKSRKLDVKRKKHLRQNLLNLPINTRVENQAATNTSGLGHGISLTTALVTKMPRKPRMLLIKNGSKLERLTHLLLKKLKKFKRLPTITNISLKWQ